MATGVKKTTTKGGLYQAWFTDFSGKRRYFTARTRSEAKREAKRLESEHRLIRQGIQEMPSLAHQHRKRFFEEVKNEYLAWGEAQGGRGGRPWGKTHARNRGAHLSWWLEKLSLETMMDLAGILPRVEKELRGLQRKGRAGKTVANYAEALAAFCYWAKQRKYLTDDPLAGLAPFDTTPQTQRRAMTADEITRLLDTCAPHRRLLYETAFNSGLRANELRSLSETHLDVEQGGLHLDAAWTKNRKSGFQPLPKWLVGRLTVFIESGNAENLYKRFYGRRGTQLNGPKKPLLYVPSHTARDLDVDLLTADIPKYAPGGKIDFHACRVAYISLVVESGVSVKEAQELARHSTPELTMNVYARARDERLSQAVERVGETIKPPKRVPEEYRKTARTKSKSATPLETESCALRKWWRRRESNPRPRSSPPRRLRA
jgi:integrase